MSSRSDFTNFITFVAEGKPIPIQQLVTATIRLTRDSPTIRNTVLEFYAALFEEYTSFYLSSFYGNQEVRLGRFLTQIKNSSRAGPVERKRLSSDRRSSQNEASTSAMDTSTPASPPPIVVVDVSEEADDFAFIEDMMDLVSSSLSTVSSQVSLTDWSLDLICSLSWKFSDMRSQLASKSNANPEPRDDLTKANANQEPRDDLTKSNASPEPRDDLTKTIEFWRKCASTSLLLNIIVKAIDERKLKYEDVLLRLTNYKPDGIDQKMKSDPKTDWICCYILTSIPSDEDGVSSFSSCIEFLMKSSTSNITSILSYLSYHNPRAIINSSRNNVSFLLELCHTSKPLLDLLSKEAVSLPIIDLLNEIVPTLTDDQVKNHVLFCILNASNSYQLLSLIFDISMNPRASKVVKNRALLVLSAITSRIHEHVYCKTSKPCPIMEQLQCNVDQLITNPTLRSSSLSKIQLQLLTLLSVNFGYDFMTRILFEMMNNFRPDIDSRCKSSLNPINSHPVICSFLSSLRLPFGKDVYQVFNHVLRIDDKRNSTLWYNLISFLDSEDSIYELDIDLLTDDLSLYLFDENQNLDSDSLDDDLEGLLLILRLIHVVSEKYPKQVAKPKHNLCLTLVVNYVNLVTAMEKEGIKDGTSMEQVMLIMNLSQKIMSHLSSRYSTNQHILSRAFIDCIISSEKYEEGGKKESSWSDLSLKSENLRYSGPQASHKFKKIPLNPFKRLTLIRDREREDRPVSRITNQLLLDGVKSCAKDLHEFSLLLVEVVTPDVMFNDLSWPEEDFLKVTIERDLHISRKFESHDILWDLCEMIALEGDLRDCTVLVRALMAVQLTQWASATASKQRGLESTQKLIKLISKAKLVPEIPFKYVPQVLTSLTSWEIFCVLNDIWRLLRDTSPSSVHPPSLKPYLERLRVIMSHSCPGPLYVRIFKNLP